MRTVYACVFDVTVPHPETAAHGYSRIVNLASQWIAETYRHGYQADANLALDGVARTPLPGHSLQAAREDVDGICELTSIDWGYPDSEDAGLRWLTASRLARNNKVIEI